METMLFAFSMLCEADIEKMEDLAALTKLRDILEKADPTILGTRNGPIFHALLKWFGLVHPFRGQERLDDLPAALVCEALVEFERFRGRMLLFLKQNQTTYEPISCVVPSPNQKESIFNE